MRIVFMGTPEFAVPALLEILAGGHDVAAVYTQPPRAAGRGLSERFSPVYEAARIHELPIAMPHSLKTSEAQVEFAELAADVAIVTAYGLILPGQILSTPARGCFNIHASLLPRWRGAAPIQRAVMAGDKETGVMIMKMDEGLDTGPVCMAERVEIGANETAGSLHDRLAQLGANLIGRALAAIERDALVCSPQPAEGVTYANKIEKQEARIDWTRSARDVHNLIRGLSPYPGAWFSANMSGKDERIKVLGAELISHSNGRDVPGTVLDDRLSIACADGAIRLNRLQRAGKSPLDADSFLRGAAISPGTILNGD